MTLRLGLCNGAGMRVLVARVPTVWSSSGRSGPVGMNTLSQCSRGGTTREEGRGGWLVRVDWADKLVMFGRMMFGDVVAEVFGAWAPGDGDRLVTNLIGDPKIAHLHSTGALTFDCVVGNTSGSAVVADDGRGWLGMSHFSEGDAENFGFFGVEEQSTKFSFGSGGRHMLEDRADGLDSAVEPEWLVGRGIVTKEKMSASGTTATRFVEIGSVGVYVENHVRGVISYRGVGMCGQVIE